MRLAVVAAAAVLVLSTACGEDEPEAAPAPAPAPAAEPSEAPSAAGGATTSEPQVLQGVIGEEGDPDAFVIRLLDDSGEEVTTLPAGEYEISVTDPSTIHNFHLQGEGVDESTTVPEEVETTWTVTFEAGEYEYRCDPHPNMVGSFTVT